MAYVTVTADIELKCTCGESLESSWNNEMLIVEVCNSCNNESYSLGIKEHKDDYEEGRQAGILEGVAEGASLDQFDLVGGIQACRKIEG